MKTFLSPLTPEEEKECIERMKEGDLKAKHQLIEHNLRLVAHVAKKYQASDEDMEDLISIGTIALQDEALSWLADKQQESGFIFLNKYGQRITTRGISGQLKKLAVRYGIDPAVVYPHSFRHRFAKSFLERCNDIAFLADLMGHESIETTRIYLRKTSTEQRAIVDDIINW